MFYLGTRERHLESLLQTTLRQILLVNNFPRTLIQIVLQVTIAPENEYVNSKLVQASTNLPMLPALLQTAVFTLLSAGLPMSCTLTACGLAVVSENDAPSIIVDPSPHEIQKSDSFHVLAFTSHDDLLLNESEGSFELDTWNLVYQTAQKQCCAAVKSADADVDMEEGSERGADLKNFMRSAVERNIATDLYWK